MCLMKKIMAFGCGVLFASVFLFSCQREDKNSSIPSEFRITALSKDKINVAWSFVENDPHVQGFVLSLDGQSVVVGKNERSFELSRDSGFYFEGDEKYKIKLVSTTNNRKSKPVSVEADLTKPALPQVLTKFQVERQGINSAMLSWEGSVDDSSKITIIQSKVYPLNQESEVILDVEKNSNSLLVKNLSAGVYKFSVKVTKGIGESQSHRMAVAIPKVPNKEYDPWDAYETTLSEKKEKKPEKCTRIGLVGIPLKLCKTEREGFKFRNPFSYKHEAAPRKPSRGVLNN